MDGRVYTHRHTHIRRQTGMSTKRFAEQNAGVGIPVSDAKAAAGSEAAHSLYSMWHSLLYGRLLFSKTLQK